MTESGSCAHGEGNAKLKRLLQEVSNDLRGPYDDKQQTDLGLNGVVPVATYPEYDGERVVSERQLIPASRRPP